jgi:hypothetical protein
MYLEQIIKQSRRTSLRKAMSGKLCNPRSHMCHCSIRGNNIGRILQRERTSIIRTHEVEGKHERSGDRFEEKVAQGIDSDAEVRDSEFREVGGDWDGRDEASEDYGGCIDEGDEKHVDGHVDRV